MPLSESILAILASEHPSRGELREAAAVLQADAKDIHDAGSEIAASRERLLHVGDSTVPETWAALEAWWLRRMWAIHGGDGVSAFARRTGLGRSTVYRKLAELGLIAAPASADPEKEAL